MSYSSKRRSQSRSRSVSKRSRSRSNKRSSSKQKSKINLVKIIRSDRPGKKYAAYFSDNTVTHFGAKGYQNYGGVGKEKHLDEDRKKAYLRRHSATEDWNDFKSAGSLSRWILWNKPSFRESVDDYKRRFNL